MDKACSKSTLQAASILDKQIKACRKCSTQIVEDFGVGYIWRLRFFEDNLDADSQGLPSEDSTCSDGENKCWQNAFRKQPKKSTWTVKNAKVLNKQHVDVAETQSAVLLAHLTVL